MGPSGFITTSKQPWTRFRLRLKGQAVDHERAIRLYGNDHSPWVQAVMLGLHEKNLAYERSTVPSFEIFRQWGPMMPAAKFGDEPWFLESSSILARLGFSMISEEDLTAVRQAWTGVMHRADYVPRFWGEFSLASDPSGAARKRLANNFLRAFTILYFFSLIRFGVLARGYQDPPSHADAFVYWEERLRKSEDGYLAGAAPDSLDFLLFGIVQCHSSIPVPTVVSLQTDPRLVEVRAWIARMQERYRDYPSLYSGRYFQPHSSGPRPATGADQFAFWLGSFFSIALLPLTLPTAAVFIYRNRHLRGT